MNINFESRSEEALMNNDLEDTVTIKFDGKAVFHVEDGQAEDNHMGSNFRDVYKIPEMLKKCYEAGLKHEGFNLNYIDLPH